jgi:hypothetical protein
MLYSCRDYIVRAADLMGATTLSRKGKTLDLIERATKKDRLSVRHFYLGDHTHIC